MDIKAECSNDIIDIQKKIGKCEVQIIINKKLYELQIIPKELYEIVMDKLLIKIENLKVSI